MRLSKIILENIKSFRDVTEIDFNGGMNIFIGPNGGGKSNLMNTLSWVLNSRFYRPFNYQIQNNRAVLQLHNYADTAPEPHWSRSSDPSFVWIEFEVTIEDIEGLREFWRNKERFRKDFAELIQWEGNIHVNKADAIADFDKGIIDPDEFDLVEGQKLRYKITINRDRKHSAVIVPVDAYNVDIAGHTIGLYDAYLRYLTDSELRKTLQSEENEISLPYILYSPNREIHDLAINLSGGSNVSDIARNYHNEMQSHIFNSKGSSQLLSQIASFVLGAKFVELVYENGIESARKIFMASDTYRRISSDLEVFGFKWDLHVLNQLSNIFQIIIAKIQEDQYFSAVQASSGESQLLNFVFGLSSSSIVNSLIIIDEPELNLHPRWQKLLLKFFLKVQRDKNCQFVISTHSASFLDEKTLPHVRRIFRKNLSSALSESHSGSEAGPVLLDAVKLLNAQQNERIFFTQKAVLVEGPSDFVIWQKLINMLLEIFGIGEIIEIIEVLGSANFQKYQDFLKLFEIEAFVVADQDYVMSVGSKDIKDIFRKFYSESKACKSLLKTHSLDREKLITAIEGAIDTGNKDTIRGLLDYIKCRHTRIEINDLSADEKVAFDRFRAQKASENVFVLQKGALESYYIAPDHGAGMIKKDTDKAIAFASDDHLFRAWVCNGARLLCDENPTVRDRIMADESAEFIAIAMKVIGVELDNVSATTIKNALSGKRPTTF